jgi:hypothetical protein
LFQNYKDPSDKCQGVFNVTESAGIYINETECVASERFDEIKQLFDIPRGKRITGELFINNFFAKVALTFISLV